MVGVVGPVVSIVGRGLSVVPNGPNKAGPKKNRILRTDPTRLGSRWVTVAEIVKFIPARSASE